MPSPDPLTNALARLRTDRTAAARLAAAAAAAEADAARTLSGLVSGLVHRTSGALLAAVSWEIRNSGLVGLRLAERLADAAHREASARISAAEAAERAAVADSGGPPPPPDAEGAADLCRRVRSRRDSAERTAVLADGAVRTAAEHGRRWAAHDQSLSPGVAAAVATRAEEAAACALLRGVRPEAATLALRLYAGRRGGLPAAVPFRALCAGDFGLFAAALAERARSAPPSGGPDPDAALAAAEIPAPLRPAFRTVLDAAARHGFPDGGRALDAFRADAVASLLRRHGDDEDPVVGDLLMRALGAQPARVLREAAALAGRPVPAVRGRALADWG